MSIEKVQEFFSKVQNDPDLLQKARNVKQGNLQEKADALAALSGEVGAPFTSDEFLAAVHRSRELTDAELQGISGGSCVPCFG